MPQFQDGLPYMNRGNYLETKGKILTMESLFANRIRDYNGLLLQASLLITIDEELLRQFQQKNIDLNK